MDYMSSGHPGDVSYRPSADSFPALPASTERKGLLNQWADKAAIWGARDFASDTVNHATSEGTRAGRQWKTLQKKITEKTGSAAHAESLASGTAKSYSEIFRLGETNIPANALSWNQYQETVKNNFREFGRKARPTEFKGFFKDLSPGGYVKNTLIGYNFQPFRDVLRNHPEAEVGTTLFRAATFGFMGWDVLKHAREAYQTSKMQEDGTLRSRMRTWRDTGVAFGKYAFRDIASWEAASVGAAIGKAAIPVALGGVSMGGVAVGALAGLAAQKGLNAVLKTGEHAPKKRTGPDGKPLPEHFLENGMSPVMG